MKAAFRPDDVGRSVSILSTHNDEENPFNELIKDIRAGRKNTVCIGQLLMTQSGTAFYRTICKRAIPPKTVVAISPG